MAVKVSIIIPVYNAARYLRECLSSVMESASLCEEPIECICVDDGSRDGSTEILDSFANEHKEENVKIVVIHQSNQGADVARNKALTVATGEWITFVDADDMVARDWFPSSLRIIAQESPDVVRQNFIFASTLPEAFLTTTSHESFVTYRGDGAKIFAWKRFFPEGYLWATFIKRKLVSGLNFRPVIRCKEDSIWLNECVPQINKICESDYRGYFYRNTANSLSRNRRLASQSCAYLDALGEIWLSQKDVSHKIDGGVVLRNCIRSSAENDVVEWIHWRPSHKGSIAVWKAFRRLRGLGAMGGVGIWRKRYRLPVRIWALCGLSVGVSAVDCFYLAGGVVKTALRRILMSSLRLTVV